MSGSPPSRPAPGSPCPERWTRLEAVLDGALELPPERIPRYLAEACRGDAALQAEVASLLARRPALSGFLEDSPVVLADAEEEDGPEAEAFEGMRLGAYRIVREIARGGMGRVFLAERADGLFQRQVALKLLRSSPDEGEAARRFDAERRILARLEHPSIARLLDAGRTPDGRPYLVTELVDGRPIDRYCLEEALPVPARLGLFRQVADAVHHAHRNLLVHRDLKPSNILVTPDGRVKLLDFGIAKLLEPEGGPPSASPTRAPGRWMTPEYAAPEQIEDGPVTTATDIYQLGLLLYELLCGRRPFDLPGGFHRPERAVVAAEPDPPSRSGGPNAPQGFPRSVRGDLDAIALKALRKRPEDRYPSAQALAEDLERHRTKRPVTARKDTAGYRAGSFVRRHRVETAAAAAAVLALLVGAAAAAWQAGEARRERDQAAEARAGAERALAQTRDVTGLLLEIFQATDPWQGGMGDPDAARELLALGAERVEGLQGEPALQAGILDVLARGHLSFGDLGEAEALARRAVGLRGWAGDTARAERADAETAGGRNEGVGNDPDQAAAGSRNQAVADDPDPAAAESLNILALVLKQRGRYGEAEALHEEALQLQIRHLGEAHPEVARTLSFMASRMGAEALSEAEALHRRSLEIRRAALGPSDPLVATSLRALGRVQRAMGRPDEAEGAFTEALAILRSTLGPDHPEVAQAMLNLADLVRRYRDDDDRAEGLYRASLEIQRAAFGNDYPGLTHPLESLAYLHSARGDHATAERLLRESLELRRRVFGPEHRSVAEGMGFLAEELRKQGRLDEAEALRREEAALWERTVGPEHWAGSGSLTGLGEVLIDRGRYDEAEDLFRQAIGIRTRARGERTGGVAVIYGSLARLHALRGDYAKAEVVYRKALDILLEQRTERHPDVRRLRRALADVLASRDAAGGPPLSGSEPPSRIKEGKEGGRPIDTRNHRGKEGHR